MKLTIQPNQGVGPITFGMSMEDVRATLNGPYKEFRRTPLSKTLTDFYNALGVFVCYSVENKCNAVEMGKLSCPTLFDRIIIGQRFNEVNKWLELLDADLVDNPTGCRSFKLGVNIYAPNKKFNLSDPIEGILAFQKGYYDAK